MDIFCVTVRQFMRVRLCIRAVQMGFFIVIDMFVIIFMDMCMLKDRNQPARMFMCMDDFIKESIASFFCDGFNLNNRNAEHLLKFFLVNEDAVFFWFILRATITGMPISVS